MTEETIRFTEIVHNAVGPVLTAVLIIAILMLVKSAFPKSR